MRALSKPPFKLAPAGVSAEFLSHSPAKGKPGSDYNRPINGIDFYRWGRPKLHY
jgi:hypothetical protein